jgi:hypothetical protein
MIPGEISSKPAIQLFLGNFFLWFEIHFSLLQKFKKQLKVATGIFFYSQLKWYLVENQRVFEANFDQSFGRSVG